MNQMSYFLYDRIIRIILRLWYLNLVNNFFGSFIFPTNVAIYMALVVAILYWSEGPVQQCVFVTDAYPHWLKKHLYSYSSCWLICGYQVVG